MNDSVQIIPLIRLAIAFIPVAAVILIFYKWSIKCGNTLYAVLRMLVQLLLVGYLLTYIFGSDNVWVVAAILMVMVLASSWIALNTVKNRRRVLYAKVFCSIAVGGGVTLILITQGVVGLTPWYLPRYMVPLAGMIFANAMNSVSLAAERYFAEIEKGSDYYQARAIALRTALIPITNSLFAVGLVSLPGMMTGQILSGTSPFIAARYQIVVMCMVFGSAGISAACFLALMRNEKIKEL
jgi:putative ABC transport system permease protein